MIGADIALPTGVVIGMQNIEDAGLAVAVPMAGFGEVAVRKVLDVADMREGDAVGVFADDRGHVI